MIEYGSQHARWPYQFSFENKGRVEPEYEGRHRQTDGEAYLQSEHLEWLLAGKPMSYIDCVSHPDIGWMHACANCRRGDLCVMGGG
jgi:hypothetical protein